MYMIYGVSDCPWCLRAQALCMDKGVDYAWVMTDWSKQYREYIKNSWEWKTYPIITEMYFDKDGPEEFLVGGFDELKAKLLSAEE
jgi:glutaredoxin|tara:strand:- start:268 stop:522 length:255 start_codon:yes stop_codon:yes gene_type:complete